MTDEQRRAEKEKNKKLQKELYALNKKRENMSDDAYVRNEALTEAIKIAQTTSKYKM